MTDSSAVPTSATPRSRVVRSLARAAERPCARPGCPAPARATLSFSYTTAEANLDRLSDHADPQRYDLCARHATRTEPPRGWALVDRRPDEDRAAPEPPPITSRQLASDETVAVLAAALRAVPQPAATEVADLPPTGDRSERQRTVTDPSLPPPTPTPAAPVPGAPAPAVVRTPRPVPAAGGRGPATDW
ncbi:hypothetical protein BH23ACT8_BH23ACT8_00110 [soil metagenome]